MDAATVYSITGAISLIGGIILAYIKYFRGIKLVTSSTLIKETTTEDILPRIVIVDDNRELLQALRLFLNGDYDVREFEFPHDAINKIMSWHEANKYLDLAIIDYGMTQLSGVQVVKIIRILYPKTKIVFFSGGAINIERNERILVDDVWQKPMKNIKKAVDDILDTQN